MCELTFKHYAIPRFCAIAENDLGREEVPVNDLVREEVPVNDFEPTTADRSRPQPGPQPTAADHSRVHSRPQPTKVMTIDKSWTTISNRNSEAFLDGFFAFIKHCEPLLHPITQKIRCPCSRCCNRDDKFVTLKTLEVHISSHGFDQHYTTWKYHGEPTLPLPPPVPHSPEHIDMDAFFEDISANNVPTPPTQTTGPQPAQTTGPNNEFEELLSRSTQKLYPGCDMTTLEFTTEISHIKALHKITDAGFNKILALLQKACPPSKGYNFPSSYYEIKKTYKKIGLGYESIHACINDCFLFWGSEDNLKMPNCPIYKASRWNMSVMGRKLSGGGSTSRRRANRAFGDVMTRDQITQMFRQQEQEKELLRKQAEEAHARAYLAALKADAAAQRANVAQKNSEANNAAL
ncbi:zinc finger, CCHC-type containing protein, partial [Tanacetum coccineum]